MAKNAKELGQVKARQTKLGKKSVEDLIQIILRKDATERKLNGNIVNLKAEVNSLTSRVDNFDKDQEGNIKAIEKWRLETEKQKELVSSLTDKVSNTAAELRDTKEVVEKKDKTIKVYKTLSIILAVLILVEVVINVIV